MTYRGRIKELKNQRLSYIEFLKSNEGDDQGDWLLISEIERLQNQIDLYESKPISELLKKCHFWDLEKESELNFINLKPHDVRAIVI